MKGGWVAEKVHKRPLRGFLKTAGRSFLRSSSAFALLPAGIPCSIQSNSHKGQQEKDPNLLGDGPALRAATWELCCPRTGNSHVPDSIFSLSNVILTMQNRPRTFSDAAKMEFLPLPRSPDLTAPSLPLSLTLYLKYVTCKLLWFKY